ncbi:TonB-dependent receptor [Pedobacter psychrophilus]|uniref:TonB-dependent receptor n=1 Tax=Pedobacter psychrophilus TaxID=1826909 RepID=A0A179DCY4_9SPHI|nr:TonB-dependent receptor [Pedobacter psychrophilus]OAQ38916.1 TonB-dependent receptor [Pedobacter psychrophilus]
MKNKYPNLQIIVLLIFLLATSIQNVLAQDIKKFKISGIVMENGKPLEDAMVILKPKQKVAYTNENGVYNFNNLVAGNYIISVKVTGANLQEKEINLNQNVINFDFKFDAQKLNEVKVVSNKTINQNPISVGKSSIKGFDLPQSVSIINNEIIENQQVNKLSDVIQNVNGVALGTARGGTGESFYSRGYSLGRNSLLKNGSAVSSSVMPEASTLESVEVLKGSAALLYGNVSSGAVVNMVTKKPKYEFGGEVSLRTGSYDTYKPIVDVYGPISKDLAFRVVSTYENAASFRNNVKTDKIYVSPSLNYKIGEKTNVLLQADYLKYDNTPDFGIGTLDGKIPTTINRESSFNTPWAFNKVNQTTTSIIVDRELQNNWNLNFIAGYQNYDRNYFSTERIQAAANGDLSRNLTRANSFENYFNGQLNLTGKLKVGKIEHQILLGTDADSYKTTNNGYASLPTYDKINTLDANKFTARTDEPTVNLLTITQSPTYRFGVYAQDLISLTEKFKVLAGLRYSYQMIDNQSIKDVKTGASSINTLSNRSDDAFSPRLGLVYQPNKTTSFFGSYANSFEVNTGTDVTFNNLAPSIINQFELGLKKDLFQSKFSANFTIYKIINSNTTQQAEFLADGKTINNDNKIQEFLGETTSDGFEIDLSGRIVGQLSFLAGYSYNFMRFTDVSTAKNSPILGEEFVRNVPHTANGTLFYTFKDGKVKGLKFGASSFYTGNRFAGWNNKVGQSQTESRILPLDGFTTFDFSAGYSFKKISILAKISNITDELNYVVHENYSVNPIAPRQFLTTISYKF